MYEPLAEYVCRNSGSYILYIAYTHRNHVYSNADYLGKCFYRVY